MMRSTLIVTTALIVLSVFFIVVNGRSTVKNEKQLLRTNMKANPRACVDTPKWKDSSSYSCAEYRSSGFCRNGQVTPAYAADGAGEHCCGCGKKAGEKDVQKEENDKEEDEKKDEKKEDKENQVPKSTAVRHWGTV